MSNGRRGRREALDVKKKMQDQGKKTGRLPALLCCLVCPTRGRWPHRAASQWHYSSEQRCLVLPLPPCFAVSLACR